MIWLDQYYAVLVLAILVSVSLVIITYYLSLTDPQGNIRRLGGQVRGVVLGTASFFLVLLFMNPPTEFNGMAPQPGKKEQGRTLSIDKNMLVELEIKKVFEEIKARIDHIDLWFHWKFLLVGGVMIAFLTRFPLEPLHQAVKSPAVALILAFSCVIAFAADIHIRIEGAMTGLLGRWIADYVEPDPLFWERFLRDPQGNLHTSSIAQLTFAPHLSDVAPIHFVYLGISRNRPPRTQ